MEVWNCMLGNGGVEAAGYLLVFRTTAPPSERLLELQDQAVCSAGSSDALLSPGMEPPFSAGVHTGPSVPVPAHLKRKRLGWTPDLNPSYSFLLHSSSNGRHFSEFKGTASVQTYQTESLMGLTFDLSCVFGRQSLEAVLEFICTSFGSSAQTEGSPENRVGETKEALMK